MKRIIIIITLVMLLKPILPVIEYAVNYDYISKVLCVNKEKPKLQCNGKCHLTKELAKASENEKPISSDKKMVSHEFETLFFEEIKSFLIRPVYFDNNTKTNSNYSNLYFYLESSSVFHPPTILS